MKKTIGTNGKEKTYAYVHQLVEDQESPVKCSSEKGKHDH